jgi:FKBP-type peptidyl-prolyl cis-trans isomerase 2
MMENSSTKNRSMDNGEHVVKPGVTVIMEFSVKLANGKEVDSSSRTGGMVSFVCGDKKFPEPVERGIIGMQPGESRIIPVEPVFTYGYYDPRQQMLVAMERITEHIEPGKIIKAPDEFGIRRQAVVRSVWHGAILVDFNHPLAGQVLYFNVHVKGIRENLQT